MHIKNYRIFYEEKGSGPAIIFFHGFGGNHVVWSEQIGFFTHHGYQTITFDQPGHGETTGDYPQSIRNLIDCSRELIAKLNISRPILIGHSMGCSVIWGLMKYYPDLSIKAAITIDQSPKMLNDSQWPYGFLDLNNDNYQNTIIENRHVKETLYGLDNRVWQKLAPFKQKFPFNRNKNIALMLDHVQKDWRKIVYKIDIPYLHIASKKSPYFNLGYVNLIRKENSNIKIKIVSNVGHDAMAEKPDEFNRYVNSFLLKIKE